MTMYTVDVYSGSSDNIIRDQHAQGVIIKATQGTGYVNPKCNHQYDLAKSLERSWVCITMQAVAIQKAKHSSLLTTFVTMLGLVF